jgi:hypothetical protein
MIVQTKLHSRSDCCIKSAQICISSFGKHSAIAKTRCKQKDLLWMAAKDSKPSSWTKRLGTALIFSSIIYGLNTAPDVLKGVERDFQLQAIDSQSIGSKDIDAALSILKGKFALLPKSEIEARISTLRSRPTANLRLSDLTRAMGDRYTRVVSPNELASLSRFDASGLGLVLREEDGGVYLSSAGRTDALLQPDSKVLRIAGVNRPNLFESSELLLLSSKPVTLALLPPTPAAAAPPVPAVAAEAAGDAAAAATVSVDRVQNAAAAARGTSVRAALLGSGGGGGGRIGYIRISEFDAAAGDQVWIRGEKPRRFGASYGGHGTMISGQTVVTRIVLRRYIEPCEHVHMCTRAHESELLLHATAMREGE